MPTKPAIQIQWADYLVDHFSSFFSKQWDGIIAESLAAKQLPNYALGYTFAALQEVLDCVTVSAKQATATGFSPSLNYQKVLQRQQQRRQVSEACREAILDSLRGIERMDRRDYSARTGFRSLGDYFFEGIRLVLKSNIVSDSLDDHFFTACYFGESGYYAMLQAGVSPDLLLVNYSGPGKKFSVLPESIARFANYLNDGEVAEFRHLLVGSHRGEKTLSVDEVIFKDCEFGAQAMGVATNAFFENCVLEEDSFKRYENTTFKDCSISKNGSGQADKGILTVDLDGPNPGVDFLNCNFYGAFFEHNSSSINLYDCSFSSGELCNANIGLLSGDYSLVRIDDCRVDSIVPGTRIGDLSHSVVGHATQAYFLGSLRDVGFNGQVDGCFFGGEQKTLLDRVRFGNAKMSASVESIEKYRDGGEKQQACRVSNSAFSKTVFFNHVSFDCVLQDPDFSGSVAGIQSIRDIRLKVKIQQSFQGVAFGVIETSGDGGIRAIVGGSIATLDGRVEHISHALIRSMGKNARVGTYEVIMDRSLRQQWNIKSGPVLIGIMRGEIDKLTCMGFGNEDLSIGTVIGKIGEFHPCVRIHQLIKGGTIIFSEDTDIDKALEKNCIQGFKGGRFGAWEQGNGKKAIEYYFDGADYGQRDMIDHVKGIFDNLG